MIALSPIVRWFVVAALLGVASGACYVCIRRLKLLIPALLLTPLPALLFLRLTTAVYSDATPEQQDSGLALSALACYLPPALGALTAFLVERAGRTATKPQAGPLAQD